MNYPPPPKKKNLKLVRDLSIVVKTFLKRDLIHSYTYSPILAQTLHSVVLRVDSNLKCFIYKQTFQIPIFFANPKI